MAGTEVDHDGPEPQYIGPFRLLERLGEGGMGVVWLAERREPIEQRVALKVIRGDRVDRTYRARFAMEQAALARMDHPNIARLLDAGEHEGQLWFAMEHVPGVPLTDYCRQHRLSLEARLQLFAQICDGVQHAHTRGILHRDLKPGNILVREVDDRPLAKIIDFGLARPVDPLQVRATLHELGRQVVGTFAYMSPEQAGIGEGDVDMRTDVYALGVVMYELLTGAVPLDLAEVERRGLPWIGELLREHEPKKPSTRLSSLGEALSTTAAERGLSPARLQARVRGELDWVTMKALARDRQRRYESAREFGRDVERWLRQLPVSAGPPSVAYVVRKWLQRHAWGAAVAAMMVVGAVVGGIVLAVAEARAAAAEARQRRLARGFLAAEFVRQGEDALWPATAAQVPAMRAWLAAVDDLGDLGRELRDLAAALARDPVDADSPAQRDLAATGLRHAEALVALRARVVARVERAEAEQSRTVQAFAERWRLAQAAVAADPRFTGFTLPVCAGLVPLGADPASHLEEFYLPVAAGDDDGVGPVQLPERRPGGSFEVGPATGLVFVLVPGGTFTVPDAAAPIQRDLGPFLIAKYEMTQAQFARLHGEGVRGPVALDDHNLANVPRWLQREPGGELEVQNDGPPADWRAVTWVHPVQQVAFREVRRVLPRWNLELPTVAQWWWAANGEAGAQELRFGWCEPLGRFVNFADQVFAAYAAEAPRIVPGEPSATWDGFAWHAPVDCLAPNPFGLHAMFGNVAEFVRDAFVPEVPTLASDREQVTREPTRAVDRAQYLGGAYDGKAADLPGGKGSNYPAWKGRQIPTVNLDYRVGLRPIWRW